MIKLTRQADYGIVLLSHMVLAGNDAVASARDLAEVSRLPLPMVGKILTELSRVGILSSSRGTKGGYRLARSPEEISVELIIRALEGPIAIMQCLGPLASKCEHEPTCVARGPWERINAAINAALANVSLQDIARPQSPAAVVGGPGLGA